jgi:PadR family transcriptional regulator, regulatory protein PadR
MRRTDALVRVAVALMADPYGTHYGYPLGRVTGLRSGALYPILGRLLHEGWVSDDWEDPEIARAEGRPSRRFYRLTDLGRQKLGAIRHEASLDVRYSSPFVPLAGGR